MRRLSFVALSLAAGLFLALAGTALADFHIEKLRIQADPQGPAVQRIPKGSTIVYASFDYAEAQNSPVQIKLYDPQGQVIFLDQKTYTGKGSDTFKIDNKGIAFKEGVYVLNAYVGNGLYLSSSLEWVVGDGPLPSNEPSKGEPVMTVVVNGPPGSVAPNAPESPSASGLDLGGNMGMVLAAGGVAVILLIFIVLWALRGLLSPH
ncbi:MAG: hypothetical protein HY326_08610 [Chloroflexi bacterium]|nr:hypothetical protein [Chloroflexota bacterium]